MSKIIVSPASFEKGYQEKFKECFGKNVMAVEDGQLIEI